MAETYSNLYSIGPGAVGQGTYVVKSLTNPSRSRGVLTALYKNDSGVTPSGLSVLESQMPRNYPGTTIPLNYTFARLLSDKLALLVGNYGTNGGSANGFREVFDMGPNGSRTRTTYNLTPAFLGSKRGRDASGFPRAIHNPQPLDVIRWSSVVYSDVRPVYYGQLKGKFNANNYRIDNYSFARGTLRFEGMWIKHQKYGGIDRWIRSYAATHDATGWTNDTLVAGPSVGGVVPTWRLGDPAPEYNPDDLVVFPNLP